MADRAEKIRQILDQIDRAEHNVLRVPSRLSDRERALAGALAMVGAELLHADEQETAILAWLPELRERVAALGSDDEPVSETDDGIMESDS